MGLVIWNVSYDRPRLMADMNIAMPIEHVRDPMNAFHVALNAWKRKLGFATSRLPSSRGLPMWKHLSGTEAARYSALDALALWRNHHDIEALLKAQGAWPAYDLYNLRIDPALHAMSEAGMLVDREAHAALRAALAAELSTLVGEMNTLVPDAVKSPAIWKTAKGATSGRATLIRNAEKAGEDTSRLAAAPFFLLPGSKRVTVCGVCGVACTKAHTTRKFLAPAMSEEHTV